MTHESYKAWLDAMPIDDVRRRIERIERKLADLHVLERLYEERQRGEGEANGVEDSGSAPAALGEADPTGEPDAGGSEHGQEHEHGDHEHS
jgi:hypothetical protein